MRKYEYKRLLGLLAAVGGLTAGSAQAFEETQVYGIANFGGTGECGSTGQTHSVHTSTAAAFAFNFNVLQAFGLWNEVHTRNNTDALGSYWTDSSKAGSCACTADDLRTDYGTDDADVLYVHTHGGHRESASDYSSHLLMGSSSQDCRPRTNENMLFNSDLDIAVIKACQSGNYEVWKNSGYRQQITQSSSSFSMWNAFHGDSSCGSHVTSYVTSYSLSSNDNGAGENWIDAAYDSDVDPDQDDCPVSIVMGSTSSSRQLMFEYGGWLDMKDTGTKSGSTYFFIGGCDPSNGQVLPN
jgi:hypothetical protein